jgi:hypothetical protein
MLPMMFNDLEELKFTTDKDLICVIADLYTGYSRLLERLVGLNVEMNDELRRLQNEIDDLRRKI